MTATVVRRSDRFLLILAGLVMGVVVVLVPVGYFALSYRYEVGRLESEVEFNARILSQVIGSNPEMWQFETVRIEEHLSRGRHGGDQVRRRIKNLRGEVVATIGAPPRPPVLVRTALLHDAGQAAGSIEVSASLSTTLANSALLALALLPLGCAVLLVLGLMPARVIRREVAAALQRERDTGQRYLDVAGVMLVALDASGRVTLVNRRACQVMGYVEEEVLHRDWFEFIPKEQWAHTWESLACDGAGNGGPLQIEIPILTKDGRQRIVTWNHRSLTDDAGQRIGTLSSGEDMTERRELETQLLHAQKMDALGQLASGVAHDFNNILTVIVGFCGILRLRMADNEEHLGFVDQVTAAAERAAQLTRSLLAFSRKQPSLQKPCDLNGTLRNLQKFLARIIGEDIELRLALSPGPLMIQADSGQIEQVLINLAANARDAMHQGGTLVFETSQRQGNGADCALISVSDTGCGMDEATRLRIFEPFFTTKEAGKGTGLGLAIVYGIVSQHGGSMEVVSEPGTGTSFRITIPCLQEGALAPRRDTPFCPVQGNETILVAEDDPDVRRVVESALSEFGYRVILAVNGEQAVGLFRENMSRIDLCILDVVMSGKSGKEVADEISRLKPGAKILLASGYPAETLCARWGVEEPSDLLIKPLLPWDLASKVREMLDRSTTPHPRGGIVAIGEVTGGAWSGP